MRHALELCPVGREWTGHAPTRRDITRDKGRGPGGHAWSWPQRSALCQPAATACSSLQNQRSPSAGWMRIAP